VEHLEGGRSRGKVDGRGGGMVWRGKERGETLMEYRKDTRDPTNREKPKAGAQSRHNRKGGADGKQWEYNTRSRQSPTQLSENVKEEGGRGGGRWCMWDK